MKNVQTLLFAALTMMAVSNAKAQIVYRDITPDGLPTNGEFDFNGDGTAEFSTDGAMFDYSATNADGTNMWMNGTAQQGWDEVKPLTLNTTIGASGNFIGYGDASMNAWGNGTIFPLNTDSYIGVKIAYGTSIHYGWIRVMWNGADFIYKDYAYNSTANAPINAGQVSTASVTEVDDNQFSISPNPARDVINIHANNTTATSAIITDLAGKTIKQFDATTLSQLNVSDVKTGVYLLRIYTADKLMTTQKIVIE